MGRFLLCGKEAALPYQVEEMDLRLYSAEELCCFIYDNLSLIDENFLDVRLLSFLRDELDLGELYKKLLEIPLPEEQDAALFLILQSTGYHTEQELNQFRERLQWRQKKTPEERLKEKADILFDRRRYQTALRAYRQLMGNGPDSGTQEGFYESVKESAANCFGHMSQFANAKQTLAELFAETGSERILKKLYDVYRLSGDEFPKDRYDKYQDRFPVWDKEYADREEVLMEEAGNDPALRVFELKEPEARAALKAYADAKKEEYRSMLE